MRLTPTEQAIYRALRACRVYGTDMDTGALLERLSIDNRHILKTHINNMRRKGLPLHGHRGGQREGGYYLGTK